MQYIFIINAMRYKKKQDSKALYITVLAVVIASLIIVNVKIQPIIKEINTEIKR